MKGLCVPLFAPRLVLDAMATRKKNPTRRFASWSLQLGTHRAPQPGRLGLSPETMREVLVRKRLCLAGVTREASRTDRDGQVVGRGATALNK